MRGFIKYLIGAVLCAAVLAMPGCAGAEEPEALGVPRETVLSDSSVAEYEKLAEEGYAELESSRAALLERLPVGYAPEIPVPAAFTAPVDGADTAEAMERWMFEQQRLMLIPAIESLLAEESALCKAVMGEANSETVDAAEEAVRENILSASDLPELYACVAGAENDIFLRAGMAYLQNNAENLEIMPELETTGDGRTLLTLHTNFPLPGFEDDTYGYLLRLVLDGGDTEQTVADSLYAHEHISYGSLYAVTFDVSSILRNVTAEEFFAGRNRVTFTLFTRDNSFSWSEEYYKMRYKDGSFTGVDDHRGALTEIILEML